MSKWVSLVVLSIFCTLASAQTRIQDVVYMKSGGAAFTMDVFKPAKPNNAGVIFMVSGGWYSDHTMLKSFMPGIERAFADAGFTVFEIVHGAQPRYHVAEIVEQVQTAAKFIHLHAGDYGVDPGRLGVSGISSGGHLTLMIAGMPDSPVRAAAAIAPPTDLTNWGKADFLLTDEPQMSVFFPALGLDPKGPRDATTALARQLSPITYVTAKFPPTLIVQGDSDKTVPEQQAQLMDQALTKAGVEHKLEIIPGGGHDEKTFIHGLALSVQWFRQKLLN